MTKQSSKQAKGAPRPGARVRGSSTGRPVMALLDLIGRRWVLRILWELRDEPLNFRELQAACGGISPSVLNTRLAEMREALLVELKAEEGYTLTKMGRELLSQLTPLTVWSEKWAKALG